MKQKALLVCSALALLLVFVAVGVSQIATTSTGTVPSWIGNLVSGTTNFLTLVPTDDPIWSDPATTESASDNPPHMPRGSVYKLFGTAQNGVDPQNPITMSSHSTRLAGKSPARCASSAIMFK
jgi:hypothetical protein